jgi:PAS domain S-box-containing protein
MTPQPLKQHLAPMEVVDPAVARGFARAAAVCCFLALLLTGWRYRSGVTAFTLLEIGLELVLGIAFVALARVQAPSRLGRGLLAALALTVLALAVMAYLRGSGVHGPLVALLPVVVCATGVLLGRRAATVLAAVAALATLALAAAVPVVAPVAADGAWPAVSRALSVWLSLACALAVAHAAGGVFDRLRERVRLSDERRHEVFARSPLALFIHRDGRIILANDSVARTFGYASSTAMAGMCLDELWDPAELPRVQERSEQARTLAVGQRMPLTDLRARRADGSMLRVRAAAASIMLHDGPALETLVFETGSDPGAERELLKSDAMLSRLFETTPVCVMITDLATGRYLMVNPGFERLTGYRAAEAVGRSAQELQMWHEPHERRAYAYRVLTEGSALDMPVSIRARDGSIHRVMLSGSTFEFQGQRCLVSQAHDVTQIETERREVAAILDHASVGIAFTVGPRFMRVNRSMEGMLGWEPGSLAGRHVRSIWPSEHMYRQAVERVNMLFDNSRTVDVVADLHRRDGRALTCHIRGVNLSGDTHGRSGLVWIVEDVTERHRIARELELARDAAEAGSRAKSAFLANMSHEIRTPLHGVMGLAEMASRPGLPAEQRDAYLAQLIESGRALTHVISEVLDLSKIEAGQMALELRQFDLHELVRSVYSLYSPDAQTRGIALQLDIEPDVPQWVRGDAVRVRQILVNFSSNAMKFTARGSVRLRLGRIAQDRILLNVRDTGPGLDAWTCERLFTPFMQADESTTRRYGGTGLGLSICRQLAHLMGGEVGVSSEPGQGSEFWAALPLDPCEPPAIPPEDTTPSALAALEALHGTRVLVVEDNPVNMMIVTAQLQHWGVEVLQAGDGVEALEAVQREPRGSIDLVLMDLQMPRMGGEQALRRLRESRSAAELPVVAITAAALVEEQERALQAGFNEFVTKPMDTQRLRHLLERWVNPAVLS